MVVAREQYGKVVSEHVSVWLIMVVAGVGERTADEEKKPDVKTTVWCACLLMASQPA